MILRRYAWHNAASQEASSRHEQLATAATMIATALRHAERVLSSTVSPLPGGSTGGEAGIGEVDVGRDLSSFQLAPTGAEGHRAAPAGAKKSLFVSYGSSERDATVRLWKALEAGGMSCWIDVMQVSEHAF